MICSTKACKNILQEKDDINSKTNEYYKRCLICRSKEQCVHGNKKTLCETCGGKGRCEHNKNKNKNKCNKCSNSICIHDKITSKCFLCNGKNLCPHNLNPNKCLECGTCNCICTNCNNVFQQVDGETFKRCATCKKKQN